MRKFKTSVQEFIQDENGVTALEYGMIAALIAGAIVTIVASLGTEIVAIFTRIRDAISLP